MRMFGWAIGVVLLVTQAIAGEGRFERQLRMLAPPERLEQLCDYTAMTRIRKDSSLYRPDRAVAKATAEPRLRAHTIEVGGGAFHSRGKWYSLSYVCQAAPDHMSVLSFRYTIGHEIPETNWASDGLED